MTTLSVPVPDKLRKFVEEEAERRCTNKADIVRYAIKRLAEEEAVARILAAS
jgi:Arc/MetJ-type ribon-helix-helix transcriptional regulator